MTQMEIAKCLERVKNKEGEMRCDDPLYTETGPPSLAYQLRGKRHTAAVCTALLVHMNSVKCLWEE